MQALPKNTISFKAITLNKDEIKRTDSLLLSMNNPVHKEQAKLELFDIFDKHLQKEAKNKAGGLYWQEDFLQKMYLTFLESLENVKTLTTEKLLELLNKTKPNRKEIKERYRLGIESLERRRRNTNNNTLESNLSEEKILKPLSKLSQEERIEQLKTITKLTESLSEKEQHLLTQRATGKTYQDIANELGVTATNIGLKIKTAIARTQQANNILPPKYEIFADEFIKTFNLKQSKKDVINFIISNIEIANYKVKTLDSNIEKISKLLEVDRKNIITAALKHSLIFSQKPETLFNNIEKTSQILEIDRKDYTTAVLKQPTLFSQKPETILAKVKKISKLLRIDRKDFTKAALKQPSLFYLKPETIFTNIEKTSQLLKIKRKAFTKAAIQQPSLFYRKPETIFKNMENISKLLEIDKKDFIKAALKQPRLFTQKPETIFGNIEKASQLLGLDRKTLTRIGLKMPAIFSIKPETTVKKINIIKYYKQIQSENNNKIIFYSDSVQKLYYKILAYLIKSKDELPRILTHNEIVKHIQSQNKTYHFILPPNELAEEFIRYVQDFSKANFGKQVFKITIK